MRSLESARTLAVAALLAVLLAIAWPSYSESSRQLPTEQQIQTAIERLEADPNLARERKTRMLKWRTEQRSQAPTSVPEWIAALFQWLAQSIRLLMWLVIALLVGLLGVLLFRHLRKLERAPRSAALELPTHVRDLDIRPETLPDDIGTAALALWNGGERRVALALLYRGLLSRLVHVHAVPIKASSTEGDCLTMLAQHLPKQRIAYATQLVSVWQRAVYGARDPEADEVRGLCLGFAAAMSAAPPGPP